MSDHYNPLAPLTEAVEKRRKKAVVAAENRRTVASSLRLLAIIAAAVAVFFIFFGFRTVEGNGMYPSLSDGDLVLTYFKPSFTKGEIVFYEVNGVEYCGRIVAKPGDNVDFSEDGKLFVNGTPQTTDVVFPTYPGEGWQGIAIVPEGTVYILGDYRTQSEDSRTFGFIPAEDVNSKAIAILRHKKM